MERCIVLMYFHFRSREPEIRHQSRPYYGGTLQIEHVSQRHSHVIVSRIGGFLYLCRTHHVIPAVTMLLRYELVLPFHYYLSNASTTLIISNEYEPVALQRRHRGSRTLSFYVSHTD